MCVGTCMRVRVYVTLDPKGLSALRVNCTSDSADAAKHRLVAGTGTTAGGGPVSPLPGRSQHSPHRPGRLDRSLSFGHTCCSEAKPASSRRGGRGGAGIPAFLGPRSRRLQSQQRGDLWPRDWPFFFRAQGAVGPGGVSLWLWV